MPWRGDHVLPYSKAMSDRGEADRTKPISVGVVFFALCVAIAMAFRIHSMAGFGFVIGVTSFIASLFYQALAFIVGWTRLRWNNVFDVLLFLGN